jgi:predicted DNA-binding protein with PD1-like motif
VEYQRFGNHYVLRLDPDDEVVATLQTVVEREGIRGGYLQALGAFRRARLHYLYMQRGQYEDIDIDEQVEVVSLLGSVAIAGDTPRVHLHAAVANEQGGHAAAMWATPQCAPPWGCS